MIRKRFVALLAGAAFLTSGCASMSGSRGLFDDANWACILVGGLLGAGAGVVASNRNHGTDDNDGARLGAGIGAVAGAVIGNWVCGARTNLPPTAQLSAEPLSGDA